MSDDKKYLFLNSYFEARQKHVADHTDFDRMMNSEDRESAMEVLHDTDYGVHALESNSLEETIGKEKRAFKEQLSRMGYERLTDLYFLKEDMSNLRMILKEKATGVDAGELIPSGKSKEELKREFEEELREIEEMKDPAELDDRITELKLGKLKEHAKESPETEQFTREYEEALKNLSGEEREKRIREIENDFLEEHKKENEGLAPILAYFMQKWRAEKFIRAIISGKEADLSPSKIKEIIYSLRIL